MAKEKTISRNQSVKQSTAVAENVEKLMLGFLRALVQEQQQPDNKTNQAEASEKELKL